MRVVSIKRKITALCVFWLIFAFKQKIETEIYSVVLDTSHISIFLTVLFFMIRLASSSVSWVQAPSIKYVTLYPFAILTPSEPPLSQTHKFRTPPYSVVHKLRHADFLFSIFELLVQISAAKQTVWLPTMIANTVYTIVAMKSRYSTRLEFSLIYHIFRF